MQHRLAAVLSLSFAALLAPAAAARAQTGPCFGGPGGGCPTGEPLPSGSFQATPLMDFIPGETYQGLAGGLYGNNSNVIPVRHDQDGKTLAASLHPINGKIVFLSIGMSNNTIEFCGGNTFNYGQPNQPCPTSCPNPASNQPQSFMAKAQASGVLNPALVIWDGAMGGETFLDWDPYITNTKGCPVNPTNPWCNYDRVKGDLNAAGLDESQVQAIWLKNANGYPKCSIGRVYCAPGYTGPEDAALAEQYLGDTLRAIHVRYPNAKLVFLSPRTYGGYANVCLNPEPFAYEYGFSLQRTIVAQINQIASGHVVDATAGDLNYSASAGAIASPWVGWGPYLWASGPNPNSQGLFWCGGQTSAP